MATKVFVSVGTPANDVQRDFRDAVVSVIELAGLSPRLMSDRDWDYRNPLRGIRRALEECTGAVVIAYARYHFPAGEELRRDGSRPLQEVLFPSAWNQIEAAMAYERGLPLLVVAQTGLRQDAVFEATHDIRTFWTDLDSRISRSEGFLGYLGSWKQDVEKFANDSAASKSHNAKRDITIRQVFSELPWHDAVGLIVMILGMLATAATIGFRLGRGEWPLG